MPINQFDTSIPMGVKPPQPMSLGDMLNIARGAQEYQQRQKLNPVELETAESEKERSLLGQRLARETLAPKIEQQKFQTESAGTQLNTQKLENTRKHFENVVQNISTLITKPDLTRDDIVNRATEINKNAGGNDQSLRQTLAGLPETNNVNDLRAFLAQGLTKSIGGLSQLDKLAPGGVYPSQLPQLDNAPRGTNDNMLTTPTNTKGVTKEDMNRPTYSQPVKIPYPVRTPTTVTPFAPTEKADQEAGFNFRNNLVNGQSKLATSKRNLEEVMDSATKIQKEFFFNPANILGRGERLIRYGINAEDLQVALF
jgi:hypothetical protein